MLNVCTTYGIMGANVYTNNGGMPIPRKHHSFITPSTTCGNQLVIFPHDIKYGNTMEFIASVNYVLATINT